MPPTLKRRKLSDDEEERIHDSADDAGLDDSGSEAGSSMHDSDGAESSDGSMDTEDELEGLQPKKSKKTSKRKLRATDTSKFGSTLQFLLNTDAPSNQPLSLKPSIARKHNDEKLELKAKKVLQIEKKEKEDKRRIKEVIGGWGGESERTLRKVAQRGVVKLFNAIQQSQATVAAAAEDAKGERGSGKPRLAAPIVETKGKKKGTKKDNIIGRGKETVVDKDEFFNIIKSGGIVSKA
ncbi:hypothetical protein D9611_003128 [Ephemerocybe angulata]|uniref:Rrp15p-domain-containing protein n=2 Tax=Ephemerocybe angulata TaxID=980116 RepID=A0A8H6IKJ8_9AGAR|nr:hypothetical protein D9611_003128 [Tulosesus angulatus]KAF6766137.1 Rrp15p-domain-containing protein [Tulosesus angulatus]